MVSVINIHLSFRYHVSLSSEMLPGARETEIGLAAYIEYFLSIKYININLYQC